MTNPDQSSIRHSQSHHIDTFRDDRSSAEGVPMTATMIGQDPPRTNDEQTPVTFGRYLPPMTTNANSVIAAIDARRPGLTLGKKQLLLFFAQGHHLARFDEALFAEPMHATDRGVSVEDVPGEPVPQPDNEGQLNTVGYVLARYGALSPADLRCLIQGSQPWESATKPGAEGRIEWAWLSDWFRRPDETDDPDDERPNRAEMADAAAFWRSRERR